MIDEKELKTDIDAIRRSLVGYYPPSRPRAPSVAWPASAAHSISEHRGVTSTCPSHVHDDDTSGKLRSIQLFIESFEYNYSGKPYIILKKSASIRTIVANSKQLIRIALPIQCVEAVFIGCHLTISMTQGYRIPISFKSRFRGHSYRHIVLGLYVSGSWGSLGLSRRPSLAYKPLRYPSLADLVNDYNISYRSCFHSLVTIYIGLPFPNSSTMDTEVVWRYCKIRVHHDGNRDILPADVSRKLWLYEKQILNI
jgi:Vasohibin